MAIPIDAWEISCFETARTGYKASMNYMLTYKKNLEVRLQRIQNLLNESDSDFGLRRFSSFAEETGKALTQWVQFKPAIPPYYLEKDRDLIARTTAAFRRLHTTSNRLLAKAKEIHTSKKPLCENPEKPILRLSELPSFTTHPQTSAFQPLHRAPNNPLKTPKPEIKRDTL